MKIVVKNAKDNSYVSEKDSYTPSRESARDFQSVTDAHRFCRERGLSQHVLLVVSENFIVTEMPLGDC